MAFTLHYCAVDLCLLEPLIGSRAFTALLKAKREPRPYALKDNSFQLPFSALLEECLSPPVTKWFSSGGDGQTGEGELGLSRSISEHGSFHVTPSSAAVHGSGTLPDWPDLHFLDRLGKT